MHKQQIHKCTDTLGLIQVVFLGVSVIWFQFICPLEFFLVVASGISEDGFG